MYFLRQLIWGQRGSSTAEVAVIMGLGIVMMMFAINSLGSAVNSSIENAGSKLNEALTTQSGSSGKNEQVGQNSFYQSSH